ncbi:MAG: hypothetical protein QME87_11570 [Bacillota bacterium]|nr:hypothetical protein [Bacillota bacterium]
MGRWRDRFTNRVYEYDIGWQEAVLDFLAHRCVERLRDISGGNVARGCADTLAGFWANEYYRLVFPLGFSHAGEGKVEDGDIIRLHGYPGISFRRALGGRDGHPPISGGPDETELLGDHVCKVAAAANLLCRANGLEHVVDHVRVGCFLHEVWPYVERLLDQVPASILNELGLAFRVAASLHGVRRDAPPEVGGDLISAAHDGPRAGDVARELLARNCMTLVVGAAQRVKQYVTEAQDLKSIRGGSHRLDAVTEGLAERVAGQVGRECVLRAAGSVVECLVPADQASWWKGLIRSTFFEQTGAVFAAVGSSGPHGVLRLFEGFGEVRQQAWEEVERDRDRGIWPGVETLPFEARCPRCGVRAAEGAPCVEDRTGEGGPRDELICRVCQTRVLAGREIRKERFGEILEVGLGNREASPADLGINQPDVIKAQPPTLDELVPEGAGVRDKVGVVAFDGDNFGEIVRSLDDYGASMQWSRRTANTVRVAAYRALCEATQNATNPGRSGLSYLPFEVVLLSGDEFTAITWERVALDVAARFLKYTGQEFRGPGPDVHFSGAVATCDKRAPVRLLLEFCERMQKVAKNHARQRKEGLVHFLVADSLAEIPDDAAELGDALFREADTTWGEPLSLTLRPFSARELDFMLRQAREVVKGGDLGPLRRLGGAYLRRPPVVARLFFLYYMARARSSGLQHILGVKARPAWVEVFPGICPPDSPVPGRRPLIGDERLASGHQQVRFTPLWDLAEIAKTLQ